MSLKKYYNWAWGETKSHLKKGKTRSDPCNLLNAKMAPLHILKIENSWFGLPWSLSGKETACHCQRCRRWELDPWVRKIPCRRKWQPTPVFLPKKSHRHRNLAGYSPRGPRGSDMTVHGCMHTHICTWFTMPCYFLIFLFFYNKVIQLYIYMCTFFFLIFFSIMVYYRELSSTSCNKP